MLLYVFIALKAVFALNVFLHMWVIHAPDAEKIVQMVYGSHRKSMTDLLRKM